MSGDYLPSSGTCHLRVGQGAVHARLGWHEGVCGVGHRTTATTPHARGLGLRNQRNRQKFSDTHETSHPTVAMQDSSISAILRCLMHARDATIGKR